MTFPILLVLMMFAQDKPVTTCTPATVGNGVCFDHAMPAHQLQDDAWGECPAFSHYHARVTEQEPDGPVWVGDGKCHADIDDSPLGDRKVLPNPRDKWL